nr:hypothetical protein [Verrucomicrobiota bacterium]
MNMTQPQSASVKVDIGLGLAAPAWDDFCRNTGTTARTPTAVTSLKAQRLTRKSGAYVLEGSAEDGSAVIAKRCKRATARVERAVYECILPHVSVSKLRYYGYAEEPQSDFCWLFLEHAGGAKLLESERALAAEWLARVHVEADRLVDTVKLPERGPAYYLEHLTAALASFTAILNERSPAGPAAQADCSMLQGLQRLMDQLHSRWATICAVCA